MPALAQRFFLLAAIGGTAQPDAADGLVADLDRYAALPSGMTSVSSRWPALTVSVRFAHSPEVRRNVRAV